MKHITVNVHLLACCNTWPNSEQVYTETERKLTEALFCKTLE